MGKRKEKVKKPVNLLTLAIEERGQSWGQFEFLCACFGNSSSYPSSQGLDTWNGLETLPSPILTTVVTWQILTQFCWIINYFLNFHFNEWNIFEDSVFSLKRNFSTEYCFFLEIFNFSENNIISVKGHWLEELIL
jgi:hypothetical protein